eukprot:scaffold982_cov169-Amphora_coffeaeformis.AAC.3
MEQNKKYRHVNNQTTTNLTRATIPYSLLSNNKETRGCTAKSARKRGLSRRKNHRDEDNMLVPITSVHCMMFEMDDS